MEVQAWGPGASWILDHAPSLLGVAGPPLPEIRAPHPVVAELLRRFEGLAVPRSLRVMEALVPSILEQKVTGSEAHESYRRLVLGYGGAGPRAPGSIRAALAGDARCAALLRVPPPGDRAEARGHHPSGLLGGREIGRGSLSHPHSAEKRLTSVAGVGRWTAAEVARIALGDADAVSVDDYNLPHLVTWALAGERRGTDERMLELLQPYAGQRGRVSRMSRIAGPRPPRRGPRHRLRHIERI